MPWETLGSRRGWTDLLVRTARRHGHLMRGSLRVGRARAGEAKYAASRALPIAGAQVLAAERFKLANGEPVP